MPNDLKCVGCPWMCLNLRAQEYRCEMRIAYHAGDGGCIGERCNNFKAWKEAADNYARANHGCQTCGLPKDSAEQEGSHHGCGDKPSQSAEGVGA